MKKYVSSTIIACMLCFIIGFATACSCSDVEVKEIYFSKSTINLVVGDTLDCNAEGLGLNILPKDATNQDVNFIITKEDRTANGVKIKVLDDTYKPKLVAVNPGVATITARTSDGKVMATVNVRVFAKNFSLKTPNGLMFDNSEQKIIWEEKSYLIDDRYPDDNNHKLAEVFYEVELNGQIVETTNNNYFDGFEANTANVVRVRAITKPDSPYIKSSSFTNSINFQVLEAPTDLQLTQSGLTWNAVDGANSYNIVIYKKLQDGSLERYREIQNITRMPYLLDIQDEGDFIVEVKAVPAENNSNIYTSKGSNQISVKKYSEVQNIKVENDKLVWNAVIGAEEYNIVLINKETNEQTKINVRTSSALENIKYDLSALNMSGKFIAKIETISNYSVGLNSKISKVQTEFIKLSTPVADKIEDNKLIFKEIAGVENLQVLVKIGDVEMTEAGETFTLPQETIAGTYNLYFKALGNGSDLISSTWTHLPYAVTKLASPNSISNDGYNVTVNKVSGSNAVEFIDVYDEFNTTSDVKAKLVMSDSDKYVYNISVTDKVEDFTSLYKNKFTIKAKAIGENVFDSNYSDVDFSFYKMLPMSYVGVTEGPTFWSFGLNFLTTGTGYMLDEDNRVSIYTHVFNEENQYSSAHITGESRNILERILQKEGEEYYFKVYLKVYRIINEETQELYCTFVNSSKKYLALDSITDISGGKLMFVMSYYGNNSDILSGDEKIGCVGDSYSSSNPIFTMRKVYEPINLTVTGDTLNWDVLEEEDNDLFIITNSEDVEVYKNSEHNTVNVKESILEAGQLYNFKIYNSYQNKDKAIYWQSSKQVQFSAGVLSAPTISFNGDYIEWAKVENAKEYYVYFNNIIKVVKQEDAESGKLRINYKEILSKTAGEFIVKVISSSGEKSIDLWFDSAESNTLTVRNINVKYVDIIDESVFIKPNLNFDVTVKVSILDDKNNIVYTADAIYSNLAQIKIASQSIISGCYVFNMAKHITNAGLYNIKIDVVYSGDQSTQVKFITGDSYILKNALFVPESRELSFHTDAEGYPYVAWSTISSLKGYILLVKDINSNDIIEIEITDDNINQYNLSLIQGLKTASHYNIALIANGDKAEKGLGHVNDDNEVEHLFSKPYTMPSKPVYLQRYNSGSSYFSIAGQVQNLDSTISGYEVSLTWTKEDGIEYEIYVNNELVKTQTENIYKYTLNANNQTTASFKLKAKSKTDFLMYRSAFSDEITVTVLPSVTELSANGYITFNYSLDNVNFLVEVFNEKTNVLLYSTTISSKRINLSNITELEAGVAYKVSVTALGDGKTNIQSLTQTITGITKTSALTLDIDQENGLFITNGTLPYISFFAQKYENGTYTDEYSYTLNASSGNPKWNISEYVPAGKYKVWASATMSSTGANEIFGVASNYLYIEVLQLPTGLRLRNDNIIFIPVEGQSLYRVSISGENGSILTKVTISDYSNEYAFFTEALNSAGTYIIKVQTVGNYNKCEDESFNATANSAYTEEMSVIRLASPSNASIKNGVLTFDAVSHAEKYKIVFSCSGKEDIVKYTIQNSFSLNEVEFSEGTYSCTIQAIGDNERNILSSVSFTVSSNIIISTNEEITLSLSSTNQRLEWNSVSTMYGYAVSFYNTTSTETTNFVTKDNYFIVPDSLVAGNYKVTVCTEGNGTNILKGKPSNELVIDKINAVQNLRKLQSEEQNNLSKASIDFDLSAQTNIYLIKITLPNGSIYSTEYTRNSGDKAFEYTFSDVGEYTISVVAVGDYITTVSSSEQTLKLKKLATPQDLTFSYIANITKENQIQIIATASWMAQTNNDVNYDILFNVFGYQTETANVILDQSKSKYTATFDISSINKTTNTIKLRFNIALNNQRYLSSDWQEISVYVFNPITITKIQDQTMFFTFDNADASNMENVKSLIVFAKDAGTGEIVKAISTTVVTQTEVDIKNLLSGLASASYYIGAYVIGDGAQYLASNVSENYTVVKLQTPIVSLEKSVENSIYSTYLTWQKVANATKYIISVNGEYKAETVNLYYDLESIIEESKDEIVTICISAIGNQGYARSENGVIKIKAIQNALEGQIELTNGSFNIKNKDIFEKYYVLAHITTEDAQTFKVLLTSEEFDLPEYIAGGQKITAKFKLIPKSFTIVTKIVSNEEVEFYNVNSIYTKNITKFRLDKAITSFENGRLYVSIPTYTGLIIDDNPSVNMQVYWGSQSFVYSIMYASGKKVCINVPETVQTYNEMLIKYRFIGDSNNVSSSLNNIVATADKFAVIDAVNSSIEDGKLRWQEVDHATGYEINIVHNTSTKSSYQYILMGYTFYTKTLANTVFEYDILALISEVKTNTKYDTVLDVSNKDSQFSGESLNVEGSFEIIITIVALGDSDITTNGVTYLTSSDNYQTVKQAETPQIRCINGSLKVMLKNGEVKDCDIEVYIDGQSYITNGDINFLFDEAKEYLNVKIRLYDNSTTDGGYANKDCYNISSDWVEDISIYKLPAISSIAINDKGFLTFTAGWTAYNDYSFADMVNLGAYGKIIVYYNNKEYNVSEVQISKNDSGIYGSMYYAENTYLKGYLDFLSEGLSSVQIAIEGATYENTNIEKKFILSSVKSSSKVLSKLATPRSFKIEKSILSWDEVENATGYVIIVNNGVTTSYIISDKTSYSVLHNENFPAGTYSVKVRALGNERNLNSNQTSEIQFKVFDTPQVRIENGYIVITYADGATKALLSGLDTVNNKNFDSIYTVKSGQNKVYAELPESIINQTITSYIMQFNFIGDGITTIDSALTSTIEVKRLSQIPGDLSSYQGKVMWTPVSFEDSSLVTNYIIKIVDSSQKEEIFNVDFSMITQNGAFFVADIKPSVALYGNVSVSVKPQGSKYSGVDYINGPYSSSMVAYRYNPNVTLTVSEITGTNGCLSWVTSEQNIASFRFVMYSNDNVIEGDDVISNYYYDIPSQVGDYPITASQITVGVKLVGQIYNNVNYLSSYSNTIVVNRLSKPSTFVIENGVLRWNKVENAKYYELVFNYIDPITLQFSQVAKIMIAESSSSTSTRTYDMTNSNLVSGTYSSIKLRALGGINIENKKNVYYINSSENSLSNIVKLGEPVIDSISLSEGNSGEIIIKFTPSSYVKDGVTRAIQNYRFMLEYSVFRTYVDDVPDNTAVVGNYAYYTYDTSALKNGTYKLSIMAIAPHNEDLTQNNIINSTYSNKVNITKPGNISGLKFDESSMSFKWNAPDGLSDTEVSYIIYYVSQDADTGEYGDVEVFNQELTTTSFYPPNLGKYKIVVVASVEKCLNSDYMGTVAYLTKYSSFSKENLTAFIKRYGVEGSNANLFSGGTGTAVDPYLISSEDNFANMRYYSNSGFFFKLVNDIGTRNVPVSYDSLLKNAQNKVQFASENNPFKANFNGNNHTIYLSSLQDNNTIYQGLFGYVDGAQISNLTLNVKNSSTITCKTGANIGVLIGYANNANITNVKVLAELVLSSASATSSSVGGIVGYAKNNTTIEQCKFSGSIGFGSIESVLANIPSVTSYIGGIVGTLDTVSSSPVINQCVNIATIQGTVVGGIAGRSNGSINKCINIGAIYAIESLNSAPIAGGLIGSITLNDNVFLSNSYNKGDINIYIYTKDNSSIGGLIGRTNYPQNTSGNTLYVSNMFTTGVITVINSSGRTCATGALLGNPSSVNVVFASSYYFYTSTSDMNNYPIAYSTSTVTYGYQFKDSLANAVRDVNIKFTSSDFISSKSTIILSDVSESI